MDYTSLHLIAMSCPSLHRTAFYWMPFIITALHFTTCDPHQAAFKKGGGGAGGGGGGTSHEDLMNRIRAPPPLLNTGGIGGGALSWVSMSPHPRLPPRDATTPAKARSHLLGGRGFGGFLMR